MKPTFVYVQQFDTFWKLLFDEWVELCKQGVKGNGYMLPDNRRLKTRPRCITKWRLKDSNGHWEVVYSPVGDIILAQPLDWYPEDFQEWLDENLKENL